MADEIFFFGTDKGRQISMVRAADLALAKKKSRLGRSYDWVVTFETRELKEMLTSKELDPLNCAAALRYAAHEHGAMLTAGELEALGSASKKIEQTLWA